MASSDRRMLTDSDNPVERISEPADNVPKIVFRRSSDVQAKEDNTANLVTSFTETFDKFKKVLEFLNYAYGHKESFNAAEDVPVFATLNDSMIQEMQNEAKALKIASAKKICDYDYANFTIAPETLLEDIFSNDVKNKKLLDLKKEIILHADYFANLIKHEFDKVNAELNVAQAQSKKNKNRKPITKIRACQDKIKNLTDTLNKFGSYVEKITYNRATIEDSNHIDKHITEQKNSTMKNVMRGLFGITLITLGVVMIVGATLLALGLTKSIIAAPLAIKVAKISITLGVKTVNTGVAITAAVAGLGTSYRGGKLFANAVRPSTPKDIMQLIQEKHKYFLFKPKTDAESELKDLSASQSLGRQP